MQESERGVNLEQGETITLLEARLLRRLPGQMEIPYMSRENGLFIHG